MSVTQRELRNHFLNLGEKGAIYVWGANCQTITKELVDKLYKSYGSKTYNKNYYDNKLKEGTGKIGADCSGSIFPMSGYDTTASNYYKRCTSKGTIESIPKNKVCLVFKTNQNGVINHVGCYTGDGYVSEMASSKSNYQRKVLAGNGWDLWGMPDFISDPELMFKTKSKKASDVKMPLIKKGSKGKAVQIWQVIIGVDPDGDFGPNTEKITKEFQKKAFPNDKNEWDGIVGDKSWKAGLESL